MTLLLTADEEGPSINGTVKLLAHALAAGMRFDAAIVGEPTSRARLGDMVKIGRRGSLSATLRVRGRQGHVAYPHLADNPVPVMIRLLHRLTTLRLDEGSSDFQPSNLEVTSVDVGNPAGNVIPAEATARFNIRFNDRWSLASLTDFLRAELDSAAAGAAYELIPARSSEWFLTRSDELVAPLAAAILRGDGDRAGTVDQRRHVRRPLLQGRFARWSSSASSATPCIRSTSASPVADVNALTRIYRGFLDRFFAGAGT